MILSIFFLIHPYLYATFLLIYRQTCCSELWTLHICFFLCAGGRATETDFGSQQHQVTKGGP